MQVDARLLINDSGFVTEPRIHDGDLTGILIASNQTILICIKDTGGISHCIALTGVESFKADDFRQGNIVLDMSIIQVEKAKTEDIAHAYGMDEKTDSGELKTKVETLKKTKLKLVSLGTSYGCYFSGICAGVELVPDWKSVLTMY